MMGWQITQRSALTMDELHTLLVAKLLVAGEAVPFSLGSVSRYEGGSWLIAWPVSWLLRLGAYGSAATCWTAGSLSLLTVALSSWWLARNVRLAAGLLLGPLLALCAPEFLHYSYRAWGSIGEALVVFPLAALAFGAWLHAGRPLLGAALLGLLLAAAVILSYLHMITALLFVVLAVLERRPGGLAPVLRETAVVASVALLAFALWLAIAVPHLDEALTVRNGTPILATLPHLLLVRLDLIAVTWPQAWMGQHLDRGAVPLVMACALSLLTLWSLAVVWRAGGRARWLVALWLVLLPALSVGHALAQAPHVLRYYVPLLVCSLALIAAAGLRESALALVLGLLMWAPQGLPMPYQNPPFSYLELGGNALHRYAADPHGKFRSLREQVEPRYRPWFAFGYGVDSGTRYTREVSSMTQAVSSWRASGQPLSANPHFVFAEPAAWIVWEAESGPVEEPYFYRGFGVGLLADARIDEFETKLLAALSRSQRDHVLEGIGAAVVLRPPGGRDVPPEAWNTSLLAAADPLDWLAIGRGIAAVGTGQVPGASDLGLAAGSDLAMALALGKEGPSWTQLRQMVQVSVVPTPAPATP